MFPCECALDIWQAASDFSVFRENAIADALYVAFEPAVRMCHHIDIDGGADMDVLQLGLAIVGDDVPVASVDEGEQRAARVGVGAQGDGHAGYIGIEGSEDASALKIEACAVHLGGLGGGLGQHRPPT